MHFILLVHQNYDDSDKFKIQINYKELDVRFQL